MIRDALLEKVSAKHPVPPLNSPDLSPTGNERERRKVRNLEPGGADGTVAIHLGENERISAIAYGSQNTNRFVEN
ncbi:unnamed protein product [Heligmosomoides polygyrus]|uniref:RNase_PH domain-containing protein n=1 Tax=Heligmosomoides polygyrus TaxID=6339 RepID=A0A183FB20_HELPZ|nr:unnamed protein product [Heligmosomoides polygyrus]